MPTSLAAKAVDDTTAAAEAEVATVGGVDDSATATAVTADSSVVVNNNDAESSPFQNNSDAVKGNWTKEEDAQIVKLQKEWGNKWTRIAACESLVCCCCGVPCFFDGNMDTCVVFVIM